MIKRLLTTVMSAALIIGTAFTAIAADDLTETQKQILKEGLAPLILSFDNGPDNSITGTFDISSSQMDEYDGIGFLGAIIRYASPESTSFLTYVEGDWTPAPTGNKYLPDRYRTPSYDKDTAIQHLIDFYELPVTALQIESLIGNGSNIQIDENLISTLSYGINSSDDEVTFNTDNYIITGDQLVVSTPYTVSDGCAGNAVFTFTENPDSFFGYSLTSVHMEE